MRELLGERCAGKGGWTTRLYTEIYIQILRWLERKSCGGGWRFVLLTPFPLFPGSPRAVWALGAGECVLVWTSPQILKFSGSTHSHFSGSISVFLIECKKELRPKINEKNVLWKKKRSPSISMGSFIFLLSDFRRVSAPWEGNSTHENLSNLAFGPRKHLL